MPINIRLATPQDAQAIVELIAAAFHEEANAAHIQTLIEEGEHLTFVAEDEKVVGFIDGFYTVGKWDLRRLELDLLAVHPEHSGKGIGKALIQKFTEAQENAAFIRALVAVNNTAMHKAIASMGYKQDSLSWSLYVASEGFASPVTNIFGLIPVKTFTYTGIWIEEDISKKRIEGAHHLRQKLNLDIVGTLISNVAPYRDKTDEYWRKSEHYLNNAEVYASRFEAITQLLKESDFYFVKQFHWWNFEILTRKSFFAYLNEWQKENGV